MTSIKAHETLEGCEAFGPQHEDSNETKEVATRADHAAELR